MKNAKRKPKKDSLIKLTKKYTNNQDECVNFFINMKWSNGFQCDKCGCTKYYHIKRGHVIQCANSHCKHQHYLFANTIFQDTKLDLYKIILGLYLFFTSNKGISGVDLMNELDISYNSALLFNRKCRILMAESNADRILDSMFYEADTVYIGAKSKEPGHQGVGTDQQPFLIMLSTSKENKYPQYIKLHVMKKDDSKTVTSIIKKSMNLSLDRKLNTDGKTTFRPLDEYLTLNSEKILYTEENHRLQWLNTIAGSIKNNILGIYRGVTKRDLPLFLNEQQWRFNHRYCGNHIMEKAIKYIKYSSPITAKQIREVLDLALPYYSE